MLRLDMGHSTLYGTLFLNPPFQLDTMEFADDEAIVREASIIVTKAIENAVSEVQRDGAYHVTR